MKKDISILFFLLAFTTVLYAQQKIVIVDEAFLMNEELEKQLDLKLKNFGIQFTMDVDFRNRCDYYFTRLELINNEAIIHVLNCHDEKLGGRNLGTAFLSGSDAEKATLLSFAIADIIQQPGRNASEIHPDKPLRKEQEDLVDTSSAGLNEHASRYFFAPSAYNLKRGELYYNSVYFFLHDIQYGISDRFSIGMGTTVIGLPFYLTPKITIPLSEKSILALGDMLILGTWGIDFFGNLFYGTLTRGNKFNNFSVGLGLLSTNDNDLTYRNHSLIINLSGLLKTSDYVYLVSENYGFRVNSLQEAWYDEYNEETYEYLFFEESYSQRQTIIYGLTGLRFINKEKDVVSWQFGLTYIIDFFENIPNKYTRQPWNTSSNDGGTGFFAVPTVTYTRKFGKHY